MEDELGVRLFDRTARGAELTIDGHAFLPHARGLIHATERAANSVNPSRRALRVDIINPRIAPARVMREFHAENPDVELDIVTTFVDAKASVAAVRGGIIDASFRSLIAPSDQLQNDLESIRAFEEPIQLLVGSSHLLADAKTTTPAALADHKIWMPNLVAGSEWARFYSAVAAAFGLAIDTVGPNFGTDALLDVVAGSPTIGTFMGEGTRLVWPASYDLRRLPIRHPTPVYPHQLIWHRDNPHPALTKLRRFVTLRTVTEVAGEKWLPKWAD